MTTTPPRISDEHILRAYKTMKDAFPESVWAVHCLAVSAILQEPPRRVQIVVRDYECGIGAG